MSAVFEVIGIMATLAVAGCLLMAGGFWLAGKVIEKKNKGSK